jgi:hypothetical protein
VHIEFRTIGLCTDGVERFIQSLHFQESGMFFKNLRIQALSLLRTQLEIRLRQIPAFNLNPPGVNVIDFDGIVISYPSVLVS